MNTKKTGKQRKAIKFIETEVENPSIDLKPGMKFKVEVIELVDSNLKPIKKGAARLCGGTSTCLALVDIED